MNNLQILYKGAADIYLQGQNALFPVIDTTNKSQEIRYYIGDASTEFSIRDFRKKPVVEANEAIRLSYQNGFAKTFNQQAWVEIRYEPSSEKIEIELSDLSELSKDKLPLLWMGVLDDNTMPAYEVDWEVFKPLAGSTAFVSFIR